MPPVTIRHIGDELNAHNVSWAYYSGGYDSAIAVTNGATDIFDEVFREGYCDICNAFQYSKSTMTDPTQRAAHLKDIVDNLYGDEPSTIIAPPLELVFASSQQLPLGDIATPPEW